jgi:hypothetical protein
VGNPSGRTRVGEKLSAYIRGLAGEDGRLYADKLHEIAVGPHRDVKARLRAIEVLLDRGWGKPIEHVNVSGNPAARSARDMWRV